MRIISVKRLLEAARLHPNAESKIRFFTATAKAAVWQNLVETRKSFPHADQIKLPSGSLVTIFNASKDYRLVTAVHYDRQKIFILRFLTHAEYDKGNWKEHL